MNKFDPRLFAAGGAALTGGVIAGNTGENFEAIPAILGAGIGAAVGYNFDYSLPAGMNNPLVTKTDISGGLNPFVSSRQNILDELTAHLQQRADGSSFTGDFDPTNPYKTVNSTNLSSATAYFNGLNQTDLNRAFINYKAGRNDSFVSLSDADGNPRAFGYTPSRMLISEGSTLAEKEGALRSYYTRVLGESEEFANARVQEFSPILNRLDDQMYLQDGKLTGKAFGENFSMHLTQTLGDGETFGYKSNNNVYLANKFNVVGGLIATGQGQTPDSFVAVARAMGIEGNDAATALLEKMLVGKDGVTKEAALGFLASTGASDEALRSALGNFESNLQWDEYSTSEHLKKRVAELNNFHTPYQPQVSPYASSISNTVDYGQTLRYKEDANKIIEKNGTALRNLKTTSTEVGQRSELQRMTGQLAASGLDVFSQVKSDANTKFYSPSAPNQAPSMFVPYGRNPNTVGRRALDAPDIKKKTFTDFGFDSFKKSFGADDVLGSSVGLRSAVVDMEEMGSILSRALGSNVTLADGYSIANQANMSRFNMSGLRKVKIDSDDLNNVSLKSPLIEALMEGTMDIRAANRKMTGAEHLIRYNTKVNQEKIYDEFKQVWKSLDGVAKEDVFDVLTNSLGNIDERMLPTYKKVLQKMEEQAATQKVDVNSNMIGDAGLRMLHEDLTSKMMLRNKAIDTVGVGTYAADAAERYNRDTQRAVAALVDRNYDLADSMFYQGVEDFNTRRKEAIDSLNLLQGKSGQVIGYNPDGSAVKLPESYSSYLLNGIQVSDKGGKKSLEFLYRGDLNLGENYVGKGFSINAKEQFILADKDTVGAAGVYIDMFAQGHAKRLDSGLIAIPAKSTTKGIDLQLTEAEYVQRVNSMFDNDFFDLKVKSAMSDSFEHYSQNIDMISDSSNTGFGNLNDIRKELKSGATSSEYISDTVMASLQEYRQKNNVSNKHLNGLLNYALATTNEKASLATLASVVTNNTSRFYELAFGVNDGNITEKEAIKKFKTIIPTFDARGATGRDMLDLMAAEMEQMHADIASRFNERTGVYDALTNGQARQRDIDFFARSHAFTRDRRNTLINISSLNRRAIGETGAGLTDKSMSWNAQLQLLNNGFTHEDLDLFGKFGRGSYNDLLAISGMGEHHTNAINDAISYGNNAAFKNAFNALPEERREMFSRIGIDTGNAVDFFNLSYSPEGSFRSLPIIYDESRLFDSYTSSKTGLETNKNAVSLMSNIIQSDLELQSTRDSQARAAIQERLDKMHAQLQGHIAPSLSGSSGLGKAALTRHGDASMQATVGAINGEFSDFLEKERGAGRHSSYVAVSEEGALKRLRLAGIDVEDLEALRDTHMERIGNTSLYKLHITDEFDPFFGIVNREPATGPLSARVAEYIVDTSLYNSAGAEDSLFIKSDDLIYKYFQFGDYDFDNVTEYYMDDMLAVDKATRDSILQKGRQTALEYGKLENFASKLGVKNNKSKKMDSLFDVLQNNINSIHSEEDWHNTYLDYLNKKSGQAGLRKIVSPSVTMLSASLNNSLMRQYGDQGDQGVKAARVLTHYFVENLLKAQHASAEEAGGATVAEDLANARKKVLSKQAAQNYYTDMLEKELTKMLQNHSVASDEYKLGRDAINRIVSAEKTYMTDAPINPMEMGQANRDKTFQEQLKNLRDMVNGKDQGKTVYKQVADDTADVASLSKAGYDRFKNITKQMFHNNKKALALGALGIGGVTLAFQNKPTGNYTATADVGRQTLAPNAMQNDTAREAVEGQSLHRSSEYMTPHRDAKRAVTVEGQYINDPANYRDDSRRSVFGDNINSAQVEYRE